MLGSVVPRSCTQARVTNEGIPRMSTAQNLKPSRLRIWCLGCVIVMAGVFVFTLVSSSSRDFWDLGAFVILIFGLPLVLITVLGVSVGFLAIGWFVTRSNLATRTQRILLLTPWILAAVFWIGAAGVSALPKRRFSTVVIHPVPTSVQDIKAAGLNSFLARRWLLTFRIEATQIGDILTKHSMVQTNYYDFQRMIDRDIFLKRIQWAHNVDCQSNSLFYSRIDQGVPSQWVCLVVNTNSSRAWFMIGYQN